MRIATCIWLVAAATAVVVADDQAARVFTQEQADAGRAAYAKNCASCHLADLSGNVEIPPLAGETFLDTWKTKTTKDLRDYMSAAMPYGGPSLDADSYTVITAFILSANGAVAGQQKLEASTAVVMGSLTRRRTAKN